ncbi:MAG: transcription elongation factor GreA [Trueperaceae bacterium]|nr:transcription elongation factor GreA [Trueperaceae bacterium]
MAKKQFFLTAKGLERKKAELKHLIEVRRPELAANMGKAIEDGDLRESAAYDEARLLQSENEAKIADLEELIHRAVIVEGSEGGAIRIGSSVLLEDKEGDQTTFYVVGTHEADIFENRISDESPFGLALLGKEVGDKVVVQGRKASTEYTVLNVSFE